MTGYQGLVTSTYQKTRGKKVSSRLLSRALKKAKMKPKTNALACQDVQENLKEAYKQYYILKGTANELRQTALENLAEAIA